VSQGTEEGGHLYLSPMLDKDVNFDDSNTDLWGRILLEVVSFHLSGWRPLACNKYTRLLLADELQRSHASPLLIETGGYHSQE
jgi:hypothetical protein